MIAANACRAGCPIYTALKIQALVYFLLTRSLSTVASSSYKDQATNPDYSFSYQVFDPLTNQDFGHSESRNLARTDGEYYVVLPDGRKQVVTYYADKTGYYPIITYEQSSTEKSPVFIVKPNGRLNINGDISKPTFQYKPSIDPSLNSLKNNVPNNIDRDPSLSSLKPFNQKKQNLDDSLSSFEPYGPNNIDLNPSLFTPKTPSVFPKHNRDQLLFSLKHNAPNDGNKDHLLSTLNPNVPHSPNRDLTIFSYEQDNPNSINKKPFLSSYSPFSNLGGSRDKLNSNLKDTDIIPKPKLSTSSYTSVPGKHPDNELINGGGVIGGKNTIFSNGGELSSDGPPIYRPTNSKTNKHQNEVFENISGDRFNANTNYFGKTDSRPRDTFPFPPTGTSITKLSPFSNQSIKKGNFLEKGHPLNFRTPKQYDAPEGIVIQNHINRNAKYEPFSYEINSHINNKNNIIISEDDSLKQNNFPSHIPPATSFMNKFPFQSSPNGERSRFANNNSIHGNLGYLPPPSNPTKQSSPKRDPPFRTPPFFKPNGGKPHTFKTPSKATPEGPLTVATTRPPRVLHIDPNASVVPRVVPVIIPVEDDHSSSTTFDYATDDDFSDLGDYLDEDYL